MPPVEGSHVVDALRCLYVCSDSLCVFVSNIRSRSVCGPHGRWVPFWDEARCHVIMSTLERTPRVCVVPSRDSTTDIWRRRSC